MFSPLHDIESNPMQKATNKNHKKAKKRSFNKKRHENSLNSTMSAWAENFTIAATWQLKHQLAYWKARAISLEYENRALHDVIRRNQNVLSSSVIKENKIVTDVEFEDTPTSSGTKVYNGAEYSEETSVGSDENESDNESISDESNEGEDFQVSEEYIQFLTSNAKYKEDAKREKERLKAKWEEESRLASPTPRESLQDRIKCIKETYGDKWQEMAALELSIMADFTNEVDKYKPMYWPNIPLNFTSR